MKYIFQNMDQETTKYIIEIILFFYAILPAIIIIIGTSVNSKLKRIEKELKINSASKQNEVQTNENNLLLNNKKGQE